MPSKERIREREARELASQFSISGSWEILDGYYDTMMMCEIRAETDNLRGCQMIKIQGR